MGFRDDVRATTPCGDGCMGKWMGFCSLLLLWSVLLAGCGPADADDPPVNASPPDQPSWTEQEAIAVVQSRLTLTSTGTGNCLGFVHTLGNGSEAEWTGRYQGKGEWLVRYGRVGTWSAFENSGSVGASVGNDFLLTLSGC